MLVVGDGIDTIRHFQRPYADADPWSADVIIAIRGGVGVVGAA